MTDGPTGAVERRIVSVLFADLVGFTTLGERLDPEDVAAIQDHYFAAVRDTSSRYGGRLEKFIGDAAVAAFGVPRARDDDAERAVRAGLAIVGAVERLGAELGLGDGELAVRVGIATGEVVHAETGPDAGRLTGDTMNTAARLQTAAPSGGVLLDEPTALAVAEAVELAPATPIELKGKAEAVRASLALGVRPVRSREAAMGALRAPTIGRDAELAALGEALARVRLDGQAERWLIVAPPGTGKTRLLGELARRATQAGVVIRGARFRFDDPRPFGAVADLLGDLDPDDVAAGLRRHGASAARADVVVGMLRVLRGETTADAGSPDREARFTAWSEALDAALDGPEAWIVEDAHWAGPDALAFLDVVHDRPAAAGRLIVVATRPSLLDRDAAWTMAMPEERRYRLDLPGLAPDDAAGLVTALVGDILPVGLVERIAAASDGNCLFIEELLRTWVSVGLLRRADDRWILTAAPESVSVPATVHAVYGAQLDDLPAEARTLARRAAVAGRRFPVDALPGLGTVDAAAALESLDRRALIDGPDALPIVGPAYTYRHALLRDAAYASLARAERAALHLALARWLQAAGGTRVVEVAESIGRHYLAAIESAPALAREVADGVSRADATALAASWLELAGQHAADQSARAAAVGLWRTSVELTPEDASPLLARRRLALGSGLRAAGELDDAVAMLEAALTAARAAMRSGAGADAAAGRDLLGAVGATLADVMYEQLRFQEAWDLAEALLEEISAGDDLPTARLRLARGRARAGETNEGGPWLEDASMALRVARDHGDPTFELEALREVASAKGEAGISAEDDWRALGATARERGDQDMAARAIVNAAGYVVDERPAEVPALLGPAREIADAHGLTERAGWIEYMETEAALADGDWDRGIERGHVALDLADRHALHRVGVRTISALLPMAGPRGDRVAIERCQRWYAAARTRSLPTSPYGRVLHAAAEAWYSRYGLEAHEPPDPAALHDGFGYDPAGPAWSGCLGIIFSTWRDAGMLDAVRDGIARVQTAVDAAPNPSSLATGAIDVERATLELAAGMPPAEIALIARRALVPLRRVGAAWWIARCLRILEDVGEASPADVAEAIEIESRLRLVGPAEPRRRRP